MSQESPDKPRVMLLLGVTASGKTATSLGLARRFNAEIISADSMQVYRRMDIGTAKATAAERETVAHHLIDVVEPSDAFSAARFVEAADAAIADIAGRGRLPLIVAGTPLYLMGLMYGFFDGPSADATFRTALRKRADSEGLNALHDELRSVDPESAERIHPNDYKRIERALEVHALSGRPLSEQQNQWTSGTLRYPATVVGLRRTKEDASRRINARVKTMIDAGLVEEVRSLAAESKPMSEQARQGLGYAEVLSHLAGRLTLEDTIEAIKINTRRLAKHQRTWFRKFTTAQWLDVEPGDSAEKVCEQLADLTA